MAVQGDPAGYLLAYDDVLQAVARRASVHANSLGREIRSPSSIVAMGSPQRFLVSSSGQLSVPAEVRRRWGLTKGGPVEVLDLGFGVLTLPEGRSAMLLAQLLPRDEHLAFVAGIEDDDLRTT